MRNSSSLNTKLPINEKELFTKTAESLGMTPSAAIRVFVRKFNEYKGFPFDVRMSIPMSKDERSELELLDKAIDEGTVKMYDSFEEILAEIDGEIAREDS